MILLFTTTETICGTILPIAVLIFILLYDKGFPSININKHYHYYDKNGKEIKNKNKL